MEVHEVQATREASVGAIAFVNTSTDPLNTFSDMASAWEPPSVVRPTDTKMDAQMAMQQSLMAQLQETMEKVTKIENDTMEKVTKLESVVNSTCSRGRPTPRMSQSHSAGSLAAPYKQNLTTLVEGDQGDLPSHKPAHDDSAHSS